MENGVYTVRLDPEVDLVYIILHQGMLVMCSVKEDINFDKTPDSENELFVVLCMKWHSTFSCCFSVFFFRLFLFSCLLWCCA